MADPLPIIEEFEQPARDLFALVHRRYHDSLWDGRKIVIAVHEGVGGIVVGEFCPLPTAPNIGMVGVYPREELGYFRAFCTLCHELGHATSWLNGERSDAYVAAHESMKTRPLNSAEASLVLKEEMRAWSNGWTIAKQNGMPTTFEDHFKGEATRALQFYFDSFGAPPVTVLWPAC